MVVLVGNVTTPGADISVRKVGVQHDEALGAYHFDMLLFEHFSSKCGAAKVRCFVTFFHDFGVWLRFLLFWPR